MNNKENDFRQGRQRQAGGRGRGHGHPVLFCIIVTLIALAGAVLGFILKTPIAVLACLLPAAVYEAIRTEGIIFTKPTAIALAVIIAIDLVLVVFRINIDLQKLLNLSFIKVSGYTIPLFTLQAMVPILCAVLAGILAIWTRGIYTKWLAIVIFAASVAVLYLSSPDDFNKLLKIKGTSGLIQAGGLTNTSVSSTHRK